MVELLLVMGLIAAGSLVSSLFGDNDDEAEQKAETLPPPADGQPNPAPDSADLRLLGGPGDDLLNGRAGDDTLIGNLGNDTQQGGAGDDLLFGRGGDDLLEGGADQDTLFGENGADRLFGGLGDDLLAGGEGADTLNAGGGNDTLNAGAGNDILLGGPGDDLMDGGPGSDLVEGGAGADTVRGDLGDDVVDGGLGGDQVFGGAGDDVVIGYTRADGTALTQNEERAFQTTDSDSPDELVGGPGEDLLILGRGDAAYGGADEDSFVLGPWMTGADNTGVITDFEPTGEEILILVPQSYGGAGVVEVVANGADAMVRMDGQDYALVIGAAGTLTPAMVSVVFSASVTVS